VQLAISRADKPLDNSAGQDALALAGLADVVAEPLPQLRRQCRVRQAFHRHLDRAWDAGDAAMPRAVDDAVVQGNRVKISVTKG
jgi:hypothetical protein